MEPRELTPKQKIYIAHLASGLLTKEVASKCYVSEHTVRNTIATAKERINANTIGSLVAHCIENEWIEKKSDELPYTYKANI